MARWAALALGGAAARLACAQDPPVLREELLKHGVMMSPSCVDNFIYVDLSVTAPEKSAPDAIAAAARRAAGRAEDAAGDDLRVLRGGPGGKTFQSNQDYIRSDCWLVDSGSDDRRVAVQVLAADFLGRTSDRFRVELDALLLRDLPTGGSPHDVTTQSEPWAFIINSPWQMEGAAEDNQLLSAPGFSLGRFALVEMRTHEPHATERFDLGFALAVWVDSQALAGPEKATERQRRLDRGWPWLCGRASYGSGDGCDCGCGPVDPDCVATGFEEDFNGNSFGLAGGTHILSVAKQCLNNVMWFQDYFAVDNGFVCDVYFGRCGPDPRRTAAPEDDATIPTAPPTGRPTTEAEWLPDGWSCPANAFDSRGELVARKSGPCDCGCGARDPDCSKPGAFDVTYRVPLASDSDETGRMSLVAAGGEGRLQCPAEPPSSCSNLAGTAAVECLFEEAVLRPSCREVYRETAAEGSAWPECGPCLPGYFAASSDGPCRQLVMSRHAMMVVKDAMPFMSERVYYAREATGLRLDDPASLIMDEFGNLFVFTICARSPRPCASTPGLLIDAVVLGDNTPATDVVLWGDEGQWYPPGYYDYLTGFDVADLDGDGLQDIVVGRWDGKVDFLRRLDLNDGELDQQISQAREPRLVRRLLLAKQGFHWDRPVELLADLGLSIAGHVNVCAGDWDGDGDADLVLASENGDLLFLRKLGDLTFELVELEVVELVPGGATTRPAALNSTNIQLAPTLEDVDGDGDLDLLFGVLLGEYLYFRNDGDSRNPRWVRALSRLHNPLNDIRVIQHAQVGWMDLDGDGHRDVVLGTFGQPITAVNRLFDASSASKKSAAYGFSSAFNDKARLEAVPQERPVAPGDHPLALMPPGTGGYTLQLVDMDSDGDLDILISVSGTQSSDYYSTLVVLRNMGKTLMAPDGGQPRTKVWPEFVKLDEGAHALSAIRFPTEVFLTTAVADIDGDGDMDLFVRASEEQFFFIRCEAANRGIDPIGARPEDVYTLVGKNANKSFIFSANRQLPIEMTTPSPIEDVPMMRTGGEIYFGDLDGDGDLDLVISDDFNLRLVRNVGTPQRPDFQVVAPNEDPFRDVSVSSNYITGADVDGDGDIDLIVATFEGEIVLLRNLRDGTSEIRFEADTEPPPLLNGIVDKHLSAKSGDQRRVLQNGGGGGDDVIASDGTRDGPFLDLAKRRRVRVTLGDVDGDGDLDGIVAFAGAVAPFALVGVARDCATLCNGRGSCLSPDNIFWKEQAGLPGTCACVEGFTGDSCEQCAPDRYGVDCQFRCPANSHTRLLRGELAYPAGPGIDQCQCDASFVRVELEDGRWACGCPAGEGFDRGACRPCPQGSFSDSLAAEPCTACTDVFGGLSSTSGPGSTSASSCQCMRGSVKASGSCQCPPGAEPAWVNNSVSSLQTCEPCPQDYFKPDVGEATCQKCQGNLTTIGLGSSSCITKCPAGYVRKLVAPYECDPCATGTYWDDSSCIPCKGDLPLTAGNASVGKESCLAGIGQFRAPSLQPNGDYRAVSCEDVRFKDRVDCERVGLTLETLPVRKGWWRVANTSIDIRRCRLDLFCRPDPSSPFQSQTSAGQYCSPNHQGPLCEECAPGFGISSQDGCVECTEEQVAADRQLAAMWGILAVILLSAPAGVVLYTGAPRETCRDGGWRVHNPAHTASHIVRDEEGHENRSKRNLCNVCQCVLATIGRALGRIEQARLGAVRAVDAHATKIRIVFGFFQVLIPLSLPAAQGGFGANPSGLESAFAVLFNLDFGAVLRGVQAGCVWQMRFYDSLLLYTMLPLACFSLIGFVLVVLLLIRRSFAPPRPSRRYSTGSTYHQPSRLVAASSMALWLIFQVLFFVFPGVSARILATFMLDPLPAFEGDPDPLRVLRSDPTIWFDSETSRRWRIYAGFMVMLYPAGICVLFFAAAKYYHNKTADTSKRNMQRSSEKAIISAVSFLCEPYRHACYWFESYELLRKLALTSFFLMVQQWTSAALPFFLGVCILALMLLSELRPYRHKEDLRLAQVSLMLLSLAALGAFNVVAEQDVFAGAGGAAGGSVRGPPVPLVIFVATLELLLFFGLIYGQQLRARAIELANSGNLQARRASRRTQTRPAERSAEDAPNEEGPDDGMAVEREGEAVEGDEAAATTVIVLDGKTSG